MALENCVRVTTVGTSATPQCLHPFCKKERLVFPTFRGFKKSVKIRFIKPISSLFCCWQYEKKISFICNAGEAVNEVRVVTDSSWSNLVIASKTPVLVEFWAPWSGPCRMIASVIDELAREYAGKIACYKVNSDDCPDIATQYGIRSIPTVLFFKNGETKESIIGAVPKSTLSASVDMLMYKLEKKML